MILFFRPRRLLPGLLLLTTLSGTAASPPTVKALLDSCENLRLNLTGATDTYTRLQRAAHEGLQQLPADHFTEQARFLFYLAIANYYQVKFDSAQDYFYQSLHAAQRGRDVKQITRACVALIPVNFQLQQQAKVEECKNILQSIADTARDGALLQDVDYALGSYYQQKSYYSTAQDYFIRSIQLREKEVDTTTNLKKKFDYAIQCDLLSKLYLNTEMADKSLEVLRRAERFAGVSPNVGNRLLSSFVEAYTSSGNIDSALACNARLEKETKNNPMFPSEVVSSDLNIAMYYMKTGAYQKAAVFLAKTDAIVARVHQPMLNFQWQMLRGRYLQETGKFDASVPFLLQSLPVAREFSLDLSANVLKYLALDEKGRGNAAQALKYYEEYVRSLDSNTTARLSRTFADLQTRYQTSEKEQRIQSLDKENRLRTLELESAARQRLLLIVGLVALGIICLLLYFIYRNKERLNSLLNEKNETLDGMNRDLAEANETKARLFGIIGHDLRSPVSKIVQLLQLQKERPEKLPEAAREAHAERLKKASENVLETMEDLLIWSKSQMKSFRPSFLPVQIKPVVDREIDLVKDQYETGEVTIDNLVPGTFTQSSDENFLAIIVRNLLQNAVRYGDKNQPVTIAVEGATLSITNAAGAKALESLNGRLAAGRVDSKTSGLGLQIAADLAQRIGAQLVFREKDPGRLQAILRFDAAPQADVGRFPRAVRR